MLAKLSVQGSKLLTKVVKGVVVVVSKWAVPLAEASDFLKGENIEQLNANVAVVEPANDAAAKRLFVDTFESGPLDTALSEK